MHRALAGAPGEHADEVAGVCKLIFELEPELGLLCVDFMSTDHVGHLGYARFDLEEPAHEPNQTADATLRTRAGIGVEGSYLRGRGREPAMRICACVDFL